MAVFSGDAIQLRSGSNTSQTCLPHRTYTRRLALSPPRYHGMSRAVG